LWVFVLSWEYPPRIVGEMAWRVQGHVERIKRIGVRVDVVTISDGGFYEEEPRPGLRVTRVQSPVSPHLSLVTWIVSLNVEVARVVADLYHSSGAGVPLIHIHDWHFAPAATALRKALGLPWIISLHSLEQQRSSNPNSPLSSCIRTIEWHMLRDCDYIIVESEWMRGEVERVAGVGGKVRVLDPSSAGWDVEVYRLYQGLVRG